jgi:AhpD family alkylhydroperoxidase
MINKERMSMRFNYRTANPEAFQSMLKFNQFSEGADIDPKLRELIKIRASQLNGCAFCLDMHTKDARKMGESEQRIYLLSAWRDTSLYTDAEKAALALTEAVTRIGDQGVPEEVYEQVRSQFSEKQPARGFGSYGAGGAVNTVKKRIGILVERTILFLYLILINIRNE